MKMSSVSLLDKECVSFRSAWLINRACRAMWASPISPASSALGTRAATWQGRRAYSQRPEKKEHPQPNSYEKRGTPADTACASFELTAPETSTHRHRLRERTGPTSQWYRSSPDAQPQTCHASVQVLELSRAVWSTES